MKIHVDYLIALGLNVPLVALYYGILYAINDIMSN